MGIEVAGNAEGRADADVSGDYDAVVDRAIDQILEGPLDGGFGKTFDPAPLTAKDEAIAKAKDEAISSLDVPEGCEVKFVHTMPYAGTEPLVTPVIQHPLNSGYEALARLSLTAASGGTAGGADVTAA